MQAVAEAHNRFQSTRTPMGTQHTTGCSHFFHQDAIKIENQMSSDRCHVRRQHKPNHTGIHRGKDTYDQYGNNSSVAHIPYGDFRKSSIHLKFNVPFYLNCTGKSIVFATNSGGISIRALKWITLFFRLLFIEHNKNVLK